MKQDYPLIKDTNGNISEWKTIVDHPHIATLSGAVDTHLTDVRTLSGSDVNTGDVVVLNDNNTVGIVEVPPNRYNITNNISSNESKAVKVISVGDKFITGYVDNDTQDCYARIGTLQGEEVVWGVETKWHDYTLNGYPKSGMDILYDDVSEKLICCVFSATGILPTGVGYINAYMGTLTTTGAPSADFITFGSNIPVPTVSQPTGSDLQAVSSPSVNMVYHPIEDRIVFAFGHEVSYSSTHVYTVSAEITGSTLNFGSTQSLDTSGSHLRVDVAYNPSENKLVYLYRDSTNTNMLCRTSSLSGNVISLNNPTTLSMEDSFHFDIIYDPYSNKMISIGAATIDSTLKGQTIDVSTEPATYGDISIIGTLSLENNIYIDPLTNSLLVHYLYPNSVVFSSLRFIEVIVSGTSLVRGNELYPAFNDLIGSSGMAWNDTYTHAVWGGSEDNNGDTKTLVYVKGLETDTNITLNNFYGISQEVKTNGQNILIGRSCFMDTNQLGLSINTNYYIDSDGTLTSNSLSGSRPLCGKAVSDTEIIIKG